MGGDTLGNPLTGYPNLVTKDCHGLSPDHHKGILILMSHATYKPFGKDAVH